MADPGRETCPCCGQLVRAAEGYTLFSIQSRGGSILSSPGATLERPTRYSNGNIHWPPGWSEQDRRAWRIMMDEPGAEWDPEERNR